MKAKNSLKPINKITKIIIFKSIKLIKWKLYNSINKKIKCKIVNLQKNTRLN